MMRVARLLPLVLVVGLGAAGCRYYLSDVPRLDAPPPADATVPTANGDWQVGPAVPRRPLERAPRSAVPSQATYPGERLVRAGAPRVLVALAAEILAARDFTVREATTTDTSGVIVGQRRERLTRHPRSAIDPTWREETARVTLSGRDWSDCCYVRAEFSVSDLADGGHALAVSTAHDPRTEALRHAFLDALAARADALAHGAVP